jgi:hypothetical protein
MAALRLRRGMFSSTPELLAAINDSIAHRGIESKPFI